MARAPLPVAGFFVMGVEGLGSSWTRLSRRCLLLFSLRLQGYAGASIVLLASSTLFLREDSKCRRGAS